MTCRLILVSGTQHKDSVLYIYYLYISHIWYIFILLPIDRHLDCLHILTIENNSVNIRMHVSFQIGVALSLDKQPAVQCVCVSACMLSCVWLFVTPWTIACPQTGSLSMGLSWQEFWSGLRFPTSGYIPTPGIKPMSLALAGGFFTTLQYLYQVILLSLNSLTTWMLFFIVTASVYTPINTSQKLPLFYNLTNTYFLSC